MCTFYLIILKILVLFFNVKRYISVNYYIILLLLVIHECHHKFVSTYTNTSPLRETHKHSSTSYISKYSLKTDLLHHMPVIDSLLPAFLPFLYLSCQCCNNWVMLSMSCQIGYLQLHDILIRGQTLYSYISSLGTEEHLFSKGRCEYGQRCGIRLIIQDQ